MAGPVKHFLLLFLVLLASACRTTQESSIASQNVTEAFTLTSTAFKDGEFIPDHFGYSMVGQCMGENYSPPLNWSGAPGNTQSFSLTVVDPDGRNWVHWVLFNIPGHISTIEESVSNPGVGKMGMNSYGALGWGGPCPPSGTHHYVFTLFALDSNIDLVEGSTLDQLTQAMQGHIMAQTALIGIKSK